MISMVKRLIMNEFPKYQKSFMPSLAKTYLKYLDVIVREVGAQFPDHIFVVINHEQGAERKG